LRTVSISDRYEATEGTVLLSGIEALVRLFLTQRRLDRQRGLSTGLFISGYEGSPLGGLDQQLLSAGRLLDEAGIVFVPGINEELAATAVGGTQLTVDLPGRLVDGVVGFWYGKNPGLDRAADAIRHASTSGTSPLGGAVALIGDDPMSKSSTLPSSCEQMARSLGTPLLAPSSVADIVPLGLHAVALSRYAGVWSAMKLVADIADASATVPVPSLSALGIPAPDVGRHWRPRTLVGPGALEAEEDFIGVRIPRVFEYTELAGLNRVVHEPTRPQLAILSSGMAHAATLRALSDLGLTPHDLDELGVRLVKIDLPWPLSPFALRAMVHGVQDVLVAEDKAPVVEEQLKAALYRQAHQPVVYGKDAGDGLPGLPRHGAITTERVTDILARLLSDRPLPPAARHAVDQRTATPPIRIALTRDDAAPAVRTPYFCPGCPHNISTRADADQLVGLGIGCHIMAAFDDEGRGHKIGMTQMGGEGAQWIGMSPFTDDAHYSQNLGDGTFFHSGSLAVRAAVAAGVTMTYKILYNDAVAMTGGQTPIGRVGVPELTYWLAMEGVRRVVVTTPDPDEFAGADLHSSASVVHRDRLADVQRELAGISGVTALIHHDPCAAEERRLRNRGQRPALTESVWINSRVCEGCGDCADQSSCLSLQHIETPFGRKMEVHQGSCNLDQSCIKGECPSFVIARHGAGGAVPARELVLPPDVPPPPSRHWSGSTVIRMPGIGGTGVVTASRILQMAAHVSGLHAAGIDQTGLAQKGGPVTSDVRISSSPIVGDVHASRHGADLLLGFDLLGAAGDDALAVAGHTRTVAVLNSAEVSTAAMLRHQDTDFPLAAGLRARIARATLADDMICLDAQRIAEELTGDHLAANLVLLGAAFQAGHLPIDLTALREAIRLNGVKVEASLAAVDWGRAAVAAPELVTAALEPSTVPGPAVRTPTLPPLLQPSAEWPATLREVVTTRLAELVAFQNQQVAGRYLARVVAVGQREAAASGDTERPITESFARGLFALTAIKDEYEVARLHLLPEEQESFERAFPGAQRVYLLKPPLLASLGLKGKIRLVRSARPAFRILRAARHLRGTPFDLFGWSRERRAERRQVEDYLRMVDLALDQLTPEAAPVVQALVDSANDIHGYAHVRAASAARQGAKVAELLAELTSPPQRHLQEAG
jgi:indolepyruvate ferredoxin oxidoreductase